VEDGLYLGDRGEGATRDGCADQAQCGAISQARASPAQADDRRVGEIRARHHRRAEGAFARAAACARRRRQLDIAFASKNSNDWDLAAADLIVHEAGADSPRSTAAPSSTTVRKPATAR
jgi:myo-inositol-1(or 4)-monophosphatase